MIEQLTPLYLCLMALQVVDVASTLYVFKLGGYERNKVMKKAMDAIGVLPALLLKIAVVGYVGYELQSQQVAMLVLDVFYMVIAINNILVIKRLRKTNKFEVVP